MLAAKPIHMSRWFTRAMDTYPEFKPLIEEHIKRIESASMTPPIVYDIEDDVYERIIELAMGCYYQVVWDIGKVKAYVRENNVTPREVEIKPLMKDVDVKHLDRRKVENAFKSKEPIIVVHYEPLDKYFAIDGNHRIASNVKRTARKKISAYVLDSKAHTECMPWGVYRETYKAHHNIVTITRYKFGDITEEQFQNRMWWL